jgi:predicted metalloprotease with PDZ domain
MKQLITNILIVFFIPISLITKAQEINTYSVDLTSVTNDQVKVTYQTPSMDEKEVMFFFPKIIPGTYNISDYGQFIHDLKAFSENGKELPVEKVTENSYKISKAKKLDRITYMVEDTYDTETKNDIYPMAGTNIQEGKNFVIGTPGFFGYFEEFRETPFEVTVLKPDGFYGSTALQAQASESDRDVYRVVDYDMLVDSPMMYNVPDTAIVMMGGAEVLVSVYSPNKKVTAQFLSERLTTLLENQRLYLGGTLPVNKYAFIYYFDAGPDINPIAGALEHSYSSFYYLPELPQEQLAQNLVDIAAHEFFHIVTPLTIHSEEIENFDFNEADLSKHLWLYEGVTEYFAGHVQVQYDMISQEEYLAILAGKIRDSRLNYKDDLPFTELSEKAAGEYEAQYGNVYQKGALIGAMLDIRLLELSDGAYDLEQLLSDLGEVYGKNRAFEDEELFDQIEKMTYPEIGEFFKRYVAGSEALPLEEYFAKAGIIYKDKEIKEQITLGNVSLGIDQEQSRLMVVDISEMNDFGKRIGYQQGDRFISVQGKEITPANAQQLINQLRSELKAGDELTVVVNRPEGDNAFTEETLSAPVVLEKTEAPFVLRMMEEPDFKQLELRNNWLMAYPVTSREEDVETIEGLVEALYDVISGPAGERDWNRYRSLFANNAMMGAVAVNSDGSTRYVHMTPEDYITRNDPFFKENAFYERELGRDVWSFGKIAQVKSGYEYTLGEDTVPEQRGVNIINMVHDQGRWWITSVLWTTEGEENPIPDELKE